MVSGVELITTLKVLGFYDFLLPWVFTFAVVFGLLAVANIFSEYNKKISATIALVVAFFVTAFAGPYMAQFFASIFGGAAVILTGILVIALLIAMFGWKIGDENALKRNYVLAALVIIGIILFIVSTGAASGIGYWALLSPDLIALIIVLLVIVAAVYMIIQDPEKKGGGGEAKKE